MGFTSSSCDSAPRGCAHGESGQAAVETALTMPVLLFIIFGILQMGLLMQARNLAQYAVYRATRAGSVNHGDCEPMMHAAVASLLPSFVSFTGTIAAGGSNGQKLGNAFARVRPASLPPFSARFDGTMTRGQAGGYTESIVWLVKERPTSAEIASMPLNNGEFSDWDQGDGVWPDPVRLETRMIYWFPLRLPFIDWVLSRIVLAQWNIMAYNNTVPYAPTQTAGTTGRAWNEISTNPLVTDAWQMTIKNELLRRYTLRQYSFPILTSSSMRMMTPPRQRFFFSPTCGFP